MMELEITLVQLIEGSAQLILWQTIYGHLMASVSAKPVILEKTVNLAHYAIVQHHVQVMDIVQFIKIR